MKALNFDSEHRYSGPRPIVPLTLHTPDGGNPTLFPLLDTGAWTSVFQMSVADLLGIDDVTTGVETPLQLPNGEKLMGYSFPVSVTVLGHTIDIRLTFCPEFSPTMTNVLGMRDFFEQIIFAFEHSRLMVYA